MTTQEFARKLRKDMTDAERALWQCLRYRQLKGLKFRRQVPLGKYIADFVCFEANLIVEVDGGQHNQNEYDEKRTVWLKTQGYNVIRFWNNDVLTSSYEVCSVILDACFKNPPS